MGGSNISDGRQQELVSTARATAGDELRSIPYFTENSVEQIYLRDDLERTADLVGFADTERLGFRSQLAYTGRQVGDYYVTIRVIDHGYLTRVIVGDHGVRVTTESMQIDRFEELASALASVLQKF